MPSRWPDIAFTLVVALGIIACLILIALRALTNTESLLLSLVLTILSILGSWIASRHYSEISFNRSLRVFALKAAEKVNNLSNELDRLSAFLKQELELVEDASNDELILSRESKIEAAIHIINTLKSVNDTSLSDWQGVIGDELSARKEAQQEEQEEREERLRELLDRVEEFSMQIDSTKDARDNTTALLSKEINSIRGDLRTLASQVSGVPVRRPKMTRQTLELACPACSNLLRYVQKTKEGSMKAIMCQECKSKLLSVYQNGAFILSPNQPQPVHANCPVCSGELDGMLELLPGKTTKVTCPTCKAEVQLTRAKNEIRAKPVSVIRAASPEIALDDELLTRVHGAMPPQPWPKGAAKDAAARLRLPQDVVSKAIQQLITNGTFQMQIDGKLYRQIESPTEQQR